MIDEESGAKFDGLSVTQLLDRARGGDREAQFLIGSRYLAGSDVKQDLAAAMEWLEKAALQGHAPAQFNLGYMYQMGEGVDPDLAAATSWYRLAAEQGLADAQNNLAALCENHQQFEEAAQWYKKAADQGHAAAQTSLGFALSQGRGVPVDEAAAVKYYQMAADQGYAPAQSNIGAAMHAKGRGTPLDPIAAAHWVRLAAEQGYAHAQEILGDYYADGFGVSADCAEAVTWFSRAALQGLPTAQNSLGIHYATGNGVGEDPVRAFMWFAAAASNDYSDAIKNRELVPIDRSTDIYKLISAAAAGEPEARRDLAIRLSRGDGINQDTDASRYWLRRAAESGDPWSQTTYALQLKRSDNPEVEIERVRWLSRAAEQGDERALFNLGLKQILGEGTAIDFELGMANVLSASLAGFEEARSTVEKIKPSISDDRWPAIFEQVSWPDLTFVLGPLAEGHLDHIRISQEHDDGSDDAEWIKYGREQANVLFLRPENHDSSLLDVVFGEKVAIKAIYVGRSYYDGKITLAVTINLRRILLTGDFPVYWRPSKEALETVAKLISVLMGRTWVLYNYTTF